MSFQIRLATSCLAAALSLQTVAFADQPASTSSSRERLANVVARDRIRVVCFGDSVTGVYYHTGSRRAYTDMLAIALRRASPSSRIETINAGISGHTTVDALARIERDVLRHRPDVVTVMFGLNDMTRVPLADYRSNLKTIVAKCRAIGSEVILATPNNVIDTERRPSSRLEEYCAAVREVARELDVALCDIYREFAALRAEDPSRWRLMMSDPIHPNMAGHRKIAEALAETLTGARIDLSAVPPFQPALKRTLARLQRHEPIHVLAMPPTDQWIVKALRGLAPTAALHVETWPVNEMSLEQIEQDAKQRVRKSKPDLVVIAVPRSASSQETESFIRSYSWILSWSLNFGPPTWDCLVVHPSVMSSETSDDRRDVLIHQLVRAHDLRLIDRRKGDNAAPSAVFVSFIQEHGQGKTKEKRDSPTKSDSRATALLQRAQQLMKDGKPDEGYKTAKRAMAQFIAEESKRQSMLLESIVLKDRRIDVHVNMGPAERKPPQDGIVRPLSFRVWSKGDRPRLLKTIDFEIGMFGGRSLTAALGVTTPSGHGNYGILPVDASYSKIKKKLLEVVKKMGK